MKTIFKVTFLSLAALYVLGALIYPKTQNSSQDLIDSAEKIGSATRDREAGRLTPQDAQARLKNAEAVGRCLDRGRSLEFCERVYQ